MIGQTIVTSHDLGPQTVAEEVKSTEIPGHFTEIYGCFLYDSIWPEYNDPCLIEGLPAISLLYLQNVSPKKKIEVNDFCGSIEEKKMLHFLVVSPANNTDFVHFASAHRRGFEANLVVV